MATRLTLRSTLVWTHRWVGLTVGLVFTVVSISGSALLFQEQFWEWAHGSLTPAGMSQDVRSLDRWFANAKAAVPELGEPIAVWAPHVEHNVSGAGMLIFAGRPPGGLGNMGFAAVLVAPATGELLGVVDVDRSPAYAPLFLHRDLWSGQTGQIVSGIIAIGTLFLIAAGLYLWWPSPRALARKLSGQPWRKTFTRSRPMHDWVGVWASVLVAMLTVTGLYLVRPAWVAPVLDTVAGPEPQDTAATDGACGTPITFDAALARASAFAPSARFKSLYPADAEFRRWEFVLGPGDSDAMHDETHVVADLRCGAVVVDATPDVRPVREATVMWIADLHDGTAFGTLGPLLVSLIGISPLVLMWSGVLMWMRRSGYLRPRGVRQGRLTPGAETVAATRDA